MYISKFCAFNFRSLRQVTIRFENGKNVIVGKNNSGKSNIIKGLEILIGEKWPTYQNFTDNDFYTYEEIDEETGEIKEVISDNLYIEAELDGRDFDEELITAIKKKTAFSKLKSSKGLYYKSDKDDILINYDFFQSLDEVENRDEIEILGYNKGNYPIKTLWKSPEELLSFLKSAEKIKIFFCKSRIDDEKTGLGIICISPDKSFWISHFLSKKLRDSLITTTIISSLRSQKEDLRLVHYTWFGKLIAGLWEKCKDKKDKASQKTYEDLIKEKSVDIKSLVDMVFAKETSEIKNLLEGAIAHKAVSFKFMNDNKNELYKNIEIFINDGIDRPLYEKGTGIQSAIIISLFSLYCNNFHNRSSLLIAEEPELYLHPQARRVISAELEKFLSLSKVQERQLIISTHSVEYLKNVEPYNIVRIYKNDLKNCSEVKQLDNETSKTITTELKRFIWSNNTEIFFADKVILVEGGEVYIIPSIVDKIYERKQLLDYENISVARVNGKGSFLTYVKMLNCFDINYLILGDLDCFKDEVSKLTTYFEIKENSDEILKIKQAISELEVNYEEIDDRIKGSDKNYDAQTLQKVFERFISGEIKNNDSELISIVKFMQSRYTKGNKYDAIITAIGEDKFTETLNALRNNNIFIWSKGELENYYTTEVKQMSGSKDLKALALSYLLQKEDKKIGDYFLDTEEIKLLCDKIVSKPSNLLIEIKETEIA